MEEFLQYRLWHNPVENYLYFLTAVSIAILCIKIAESLLYGQLKRLAQRTQTQADDFLLTRVRRDINPALYVVVIYSGLNFLEITPRAARYVNGVLLVLATYFGVRLLAAVVTFLLEKRWLDRSNTQFQEKNIRGVIGAVRVAIWALGVVFLLDNLGFEISAIVTGLGIGGVAVALAAQAVLGDLFSYAAIYFDKPFEVGDFIIVDQYRGEVEYVGLKTTRLRSLGGEQLIISNSKLTGSWLQNLKRMDRRRVLFTLNVVYATPEPLLAEIPVIIQDAIESRPQTVFDRAHFARIGEYALVFEAVYFVLSNEYKVYMDIHQDINLQIKREFEQRGIELALPTQTILLPGHGETADS